MAKDRRGGSNGGVQTGYGQGPQIIRTRKETKERSAKNNAEFKALRNRFKKQYGITLDKSLRQDQDWRAARESAYGVEQVLKAFPEAQKYLRGGSLSAGKLGLNTMGQAELVGKSIQLNDVWFRDRNTVDTVMAHSNGFHPEGSRSIGVATHEAGHLIVSAIAKKQGTWDYDAVAKNILQEARKNPAVQSFMKKNLGGTNKTAQLAKTISQYAYSNNHETIAEAVSDYMQRGSQASVYSRAIYQELRRQLK